MLPSKKSFVIGVAALVTALTAQPLTTTFVRPLLAQAPPSFAPPTSVPSGSTIRIDGSSSMATINQTLKQRFENQFSGTTVNLNYSSTPAALQALRDGKIDLAAIGRPLTEEERNQGFVAVPIERGKIAVIVGADNPFRSSLTVPQFVKIVRGEITDWSQVGGPPGAIRFVDRPDLSDTRAAFGTYGVFRTEPYVPGATTARLSEDSTQTVLQQLGKDGISYAPANQVLGQSGLRTVPLYNTPPTDPLYPFSQPFSYVYKGTPPPAIAAFLGYATAPEGLQLLQSAQPNQAAISAGSSSSQAGAASSSANAAGGAGSTPTNSPATNVASGTSSSASDSSSIADAPNAMSTVAAAPNSNSGTNDASSFPAWLWLLLPLGLGLLLVGWLLRNRRSQPKSTVRDAEVVPPSPPPPAPPVTAQTPPPPPPLMVPSDSPDAGVASRTESVINADRASIRSTPPTESQPRSTLSGTDALIAGGLGAGAAAGFAGLSQPAERNDSATEPPISSERNAGIAPDRDDAAVSQFSEEVAPPTIGVVEAQSLPTQTPEIETQAPRTGISGEAILGGAALGAGAAWTLRNQAQDAANLSADASTESNEATGIIESDDPILAAELPPAQIDAASAQADRDIADESLTTFDLVDDFDDLESRFTDEDVTQLSLDDAPTAIVLPSEPDAADSTVLTSATVTPLPEDINQPLPEQSSDSMTRIEEALTEDDAASSSISNPVKEPADAYPGAILATAAGIAGISTFTNDQTQSDVEAAKFDVGQPDLSSETLATVDEGLPELPQGYGESRIVLMPRDPQWAYAYWDVSNEHKEELRRQGGQNLVLRLSDVTDVDVDRQSPHSMQQYECEELARDWYVPIPISDRDYLIEIGYLTAEGRWLKLARSAPVRVPPVYPSDWFEAEFATIDWQEDLRGKTIAQLIEPSQRTVAQREIYTRMFDLAQGAEIQRIAGSLFGSMHQAPETAISSFVLPFGMGVAALPTGGWTLPTPSGMGMSGVGINMSGVGFSAGAIPPRPRRFWLVADAELIVYGATEPDATVTIAGQPIEISPDGTFRFQMSFQDGLIDYPILATASDGEQTRSIHLKFTRETPNRKTNTKAEATDEWLT